EIGANSAIDAIIAVPAAERVVASAPQEEVIVVAAGEAVVATSSVERIILTVAADGVVAAAAENISAADDQITFTRGGVAIICGVIKAECQVLCPPGVIGPVASVATAAERIRRRASATVERVIASTSLEV